MSRQRFFFGLKPPPVVAGSIHDLWRQLAVPGHGHHPDDLHLTLAFLGDLAHQVTQISALAKPIRVSAFVLRFTELVYWPRPRVLVLQPSRTPEPLQSLVVQLQDACRSVGLTPEDRPYRPHVTLARKAEGHERIRLECPIEWSVSEFSLFISDWKRPPPHYLVVGRWSLDGAVPSDTPVQ